MTTVFIKSDVDYTQDVTAVKLLYTQKVKLCRHYTLKHREDILSLSTKNRQHGRQKLSFKVAVFNTA